MIEIQDLQNHSIEVLFSFLKIVLYVTLID